MNIVLEGIDGTGKSTLAHHLKANLHCAVIPSEGPPKYPGEIDDRLKRYASYDGLIFDRHPAVSQPIYGPMRDPYELLPTGHLVQSFYRSNPLIIYCDPGKKRHTHVRNEAVDTDEHLAQIEANYNQLLVAYRSWAINHAFLWYRIGDDVARVIIAVQSVWSTRPWK